MPAMIELIQDGGVTSPVGFLAGGTYAGLKSSGENVRDLGILVSERSAAAAATFSTNAILSPSVTVSRRRITSKNGRAVVANSGCANCSVGVQGITDAEEMASLAAGHVGVQPEETFVCSTGVIGMELPMALIRQSIGNVTVTADGGLDFARSIMTTDTRPKQMAVSVELDGRRITVGGAAKGAAMIHPNMATMLAFITTDAAVNADFLQQALSNSVADSFNMIDVDGDQSTNDTVLLLANAAAQGKEISAGSGSAEVFQEALSYVCSGLAKDMVRDAEGAGHLIEVLVNGAQSREDARAVARGISSSSLVKAMVHGRDPNWGRLMMAVGNSGAEIVEDRIDIFINEIHVVHAGMAIPYFAEAVVSSMAAREIQFRVDLAVGSETATAWSSDLTEEYVTLNSAYTT